MSGYSRFFTLVRRFLWKHLTFILVPGAAYLVAARYFVDPPRYGFAQIAALSVVAALMIFAAASSLGPLLSPASRKAGVKTKLEMGLTLVISAHAILQMTVHAGVDLYPLLYLLMTFLLFKPDAVGITCLALALAIEGAQFALGDQSPASLHAAVTHGLFLLLFSALYYLLQWSDVRLRRLEHKTDVERHIKEIEDKAIGYRLISSRKDAHASVIPEGEREQRLRMSSVLVIKKALANQIQVARHLLKARTVALFMLDQQQEKTLQLLEASSDSDRLRTGEWIPAGEGFLGGVINGKKPLALSPIRKGYQGITWYRDDEEVGACAGAPVFEDTAGTERLRGALVADRQDEQPFSEEEISFLAAMASEAMRTIEVEHVVIDMDREKTQKEKFYKASRRLGEALTLAEVLSATADAARTVNDYDFVAVTLLVDEEKRKQKLAHVSPASCDAAKQEGLIFAESGCLVSSVLKLSVPLPPKDFHEMERQGVFPAQVKLKDVGSIKVLPLIIQKRPIGTLVVGLAARHHFGDEEMDMLLTVASLAAIAVENGKLYEKMEQMATTDGLTGLYNHRVFQEKLDEAIARAQRSGKKVSMILMDIDHFKKVNDTHGHPVGDAVLKGVSALLRGGARAVDTVARYGGEEFTVIMEETDQAGGKVKAERIREDIKKLVFSSDTGRFTVTISLGVCTFPDDAKEKKELILKSDEALYHSKHAGRDRSTSWHTMKSEKAQGPAEKA